MSTQLGAPCGKLVVIPSSLPAPRALVTETAGEGRRVRPDGTPGSVDLVGWGSVAAGSTTGLARSAGSTGGGLLSDQQAISVRRIESWRHLGGKQRCWSTAPGS